ncbi:DUF418 domain-containing protein [Pleionea litopenaei]|uniref:DUF418 domain-containing protein n=1 Tax=Pleionea litopenaei TaxID=3070815 RepID=A0AA51X623_9GAMM|nr:DUF418 domain-containing protein [Pleionea sp. HL-JVS1]WMS86381.1 DUF418 domain-containing protein [Pleionea sp. HL-JVS1]
MENLTRNHHLDFIRGIAVLGILMMNIQAFSMPLTAYGNPTSYGEFSDTNVLAYLFTHLLFDLKFMSIFSTLFGVGIAIFCERVSQREGSAGRRHYRRMGWLLLFGLIHAYFIWWGDILTAYALAGCLSYLMLKSTQKTLLITAAGLLAFYSAFMLLQGLVIPILPEEEVAKSILPMWQPTAEALAEELNAYQGTWYESFVFRVEQTLTLQPYLIFYLPRIIALNLIGIVLYRSGFFTFEWRKSTYLLWAMGGIVCGSLLTAFGIQQNFAHNFHWSFSMAHGMQFNYWGSLFTAMGYLALFMLISQTSSGLVSRGLQSVGRMAFTNYILQSLLATTLFYGFGFGYFGQVERPELIMITLGIWLVIVIFSVIWLRTFTQGPLELLWRKLTYGVSSKPMNIT